MSNIQSCIGITSAMKVPAVTLHMLWCLVCIVRAEVWHTLCLLLRCATQMRPLQAWTCIRIRLSSGVALGYCEWWRRRDVVVFRGVPYATAGRFQQCRMLPTMSSTAEVPTLNPFRFFPQECPQMARPFLVESPVLPHLVRLLFCRMRHGFVGDEATGLQLNIFTPTAALPSSCSENSTRPCPVLVFFHGGAFVFGSAHNEMYNGTLLAARGIVVVTAQYRLGLLGFLNAPGATSNLGIRDQIAALQWVHSNIGQFGGDPKSITVAGQSAGAMSVGTLLGCPSARMFFRRAVLLSGTALHTQPASDALAVAEMLAEEARVPLEDLVEQLRVMPLGDVMALQQRVEARVTVMYRTFVTQRLLPFAPFVDHDLLPRHPDVTLVDTRDLSSLQVLLCSTDSEYTFFTAMLPSKHPINDLKLPKRLWQWAGKLTGVDCDALSAKVSVAYGQGECARRQGPIHPVWNAVNGDWVFRLPAYHLADTVRSRGGTAYVARYCRTGLIPRLAAPHAIDLHGWFGTTTACPYLCGFDAKLGPIVNEMMCALVEFVRCGELKHPWAQWTTHQRPVLRIAQDGLQQEVLGDDAEIRSWDGIADAIIAYHRHPPGDPSPRSPPPQTIDE